MLCFALGVGFFIGEVQGECPVNPVMPPANLINLPVGDSMRLSCLGEWEYPEVFTDSVVSEPSVGVQGINSTLITVTITAEMDGMALTCITEACPNVSVRVDVVFVRPTNITLTKLDTGALLTWAYTVASGAFSSRATIVPLGAPNALFMTQYEETDTHAAHFDDLIWCGPFDVRIEIIGESYAQVVVPPDPLTLDDFYFTLAMTDDGTVTLIIDISNPSGCNYTHQAVLVEAASSQEELHTGHDSIIIEGLPSNRAYYVSLCLQEAQDASSGTSWKFISTSIVRVCRTSNDSYLATCDTMVGAPNTCYYDVRNVNGTSLQGTTSDGFAKIPPGYTSMWVRSFFPVPTTATEQILLNDRLPLCAHLDPSILYGLDGDELVTPTMQPQEMSVPPGYEVIGPLTAICVLLLLCVSGFLIRIGKNRGTRKIRRANNVDLDQVDKGTLNDSLSGLVLEQN